jgi:hypothetical protein
LTPIHINGYGMAINNREASLDHFLESIVPSLTFAEVKKSNPKGKVVKLPPITSRDGLGFNFMMTVSSLLAFSMPKYPSHLPMSPPTFGMLGMLIYLLHLT